MTEQTGIAAFIKYGLNTVTLEILVLNSKKPSLPQPCDDDPIRCRAIRAQSDSQPVEKHKKT